MIKTRKRVDLPQLQQELAAEGFEYIGLNGSGESSGGQTAGKEIIISGVQLDPATGMGLNVDIPVAAQKILDRHVPRVL